MNNNYISNMRNRYKDVTRLGLLMLAFLSISGFSFSQFSVTTSPPLNGGNGSAGVSFNVTANNAITITDFANTFYGSGTGTYEIWYNTSAISGAPSITTANGWTQLATGTATASGTGLTGNSPIALNSGVSLQMNAGETYGFFIFGSGVNTNYTTYNAANQTTFTDANIEVFTGPNVSYGGSFPNPTFHPRQFNGTVYYSLTSQAPDDAGVTEILSPGYYCDGDTQALIVNVQNFGTLPVDSCQITWNVNGTATTQWFTLNLDTFGGSGPLDTTLFLANIPLSGATNIDVYTTLPNNMADTVNANDSAFYAGGPSLNGTYSLGTSATADFASFTEFVDSLNFVGVCGPVIVEVEDGVYDEAITLQEVPSMSATNTVTFRGESLDATLDTLTASNGDPTLRMDGADYYSFEHITIQNTNGNDYAIQFLGGSDYNRFEDCVIRINDANSTSTLDCLVYSGSGTTDEYNTFRNNTFENGSYGMYWYGQNTITMEQGNVIEGNEFLNQYQYGARLYYQSGLNFDKNTITSNSTYGFAYGVYAYYCDNSNFTSNHVYGPEDSGWPLYGMRLGYNDATSFNNPGVVANNIVSIGDTSNTNTTYYGFYILSNQLNNFVHNTAIVRGGGTNARAVYNSSSDFGRIANNVMVNYGSGYSYYDINADPLLGDNNVYFSNGTNLLYNNTAYTSLADWQNASNQDQNSLDIDPNFSNILTGTFCNDTIDNIGTPIATTMDDFSGFGRSMETPDPGAHEFFGLAGLDLGPDTTLCDGSLTLSVGDSNLVNSISWDVNGTTYTTPTYVVTTNGGSQSFVISASVTTGCGSNTDAVNITLVAPAVLDDSVHICAEETVVLNPGAGPTASITWFPGNENTATLDVSTPGFYSVTKVEDGCESTTSTIVTQSEGVGVLDIEPCDADLPASISVAIANGDSYSWSGGSAPSSATNTFDASGDYAVTATDAFGCVSSDSFSVAVIDVPNAKINETHAGTVYMFNSDASTDVGSGASYLWQFGDGGTSTMANPTHVYNWGNPSSVPQYNVSLSITNNCGTDDDSELIIPDVLGVEDANANSGYSVFPNPTNSNWNVQFDNQVNEVSIEVIDITGRIVASFNNVDGNNVLVDATMLPSGNYIMKVTADDSTSYSRVSVSR
jgi:hypothetical protein